MKMLGEVTFYKLEKRYLLESPANEVLDGGTRNANQTGLFSTNYYIFFIRFSPL